MLVDELLISPPGRYNCCLNKIIYNINFSREGNTRFIRIEGKLDLKFSPGKFGIVSNLLKGIVWISSETVSVEDLKANSDEEENILMIINKFSKYYKLKFVILNDSSLVSIKDKFICLPSYLYLSEGKQYYERYGFQPYIQKYHLCNDKFTFNVSILKDMAWTLDETRSIRRESILEMSIPEYIKFIERNIGEIGELKKLEMIVGDRKIKDLLRDEEHKYRTSYHLEDSLKRMNLVFEKLIIFY